MSTQRCLQAMGVTVRRDGLRTVVIGAGLRGLQALREPLDCGNSGTTLRLLMGVLAGRPFSCELTGDASLLRRPMRRVAEPLERMGARICLTNEAHGPVRIESGPQLSAIDFVLDVASAQVKSAILLAALRAQGTTRLTGQIGSRDHTERLLPHFGASIDTCAERISLRGVQHLQAASLKIPGDPSSAAFWVAAACVVPSSRLVLNNVLLNPTRTGFFRVLQRMGASLEVAVTSCSPEVVGDLVCCGAALHGVTVEAGEVPSMIDELPALAVAATQACGRTEVRGAAELRLKETDRIEAMAENLRRMGARIETFTDGFRIDGPQRLHGAPVDSFGDHRVAMAMAVAGLAAEGETCIEGAEAVDVSYPDFFRALAQVIR